MKVDNIKIKKVENGGRLLAYASVVLNECFVIHNIRIINGDKGMFIAMPSIKSETGHKDICHPINQVFRNTLTTAIIDNYKNLEN